MRPEVQVGKAIKNPCDQNASFKSQILNVKQHSATPLTNPNSSAQPCPIPDIPHSTITNTGEIAIGAALTITCDANYEISDDSTITCVSGTVFSKALPTCDRES